MQPKLTSGAIDRILGGEDVSTAVIQILGCKKIPGTGNDRYRLLISDGITGCPFAMLGTQLNHLVTNKELEKFTIVRVDKWVCNQVQPDRKVIILLNLTVLTPGAEVAEKLGNPVNSSVTASSNVSAAPEAPKTSNTNSTSNSYSNIERRIPVQHGNLTNGSSQPVHPISSLTPYQNKWTIRARVTSKTPIRTWSNSRGEGKLFSVNFLDESGEIRATAFNEAVDKYYDLLEVNKVFYISRGTLKTANKQYSTVKNDYEMTFNNDTSIVACDESVSSIPVLQFDFIPISQLEQMEKDAFVDVIGICKSTGDVQTFVARTTNKELVKRDVVLVDRSNKEVNLTLWGSDAEKFDGSSNPVVSVKGAKVSDFNGRSLSVSMSSNMQINPDIKEAHMLKGWYDREGCNMESQSISGKGGGLSGNTGGQWKTFAQAVSEQLGMGDKPDYYVNKATVVMLRKENCMYMACPSEECNKKVIDMNNGIYRCEKCNREYSEFKWRMLLQVSAADFTENQWVTCFQDAGEAILNIKPQELGAFKETDEEKYNEILGDVNFKSFIFKFRTKMETFNEESRLKTTVVSASPVEPISYTRKILSDIKQMEQEL